LSQNKLSGLRWERPFSVKDSIFRDRYDATGKVILRVQMQSFDMGRRSEDASLENRRGNRFGRWVGWMRRKLDASGSYRDSDRHSRVADSCNREQPAWITAWSDTIFVQRNRHFHIYGELVHLSAASESYGEKSNTVKLRAADRVWNDKQQWPLCGSAYSADTEYFRGCGAEYGQHEHLWNQFCSSRLRRACFHSTDQRDDRSGRKRFIHADSQRRRKYGRDVERNS
jgi:hypothetical protein